MDVAIRGFDWQDLDPLTALHNEVSGVSGSDRALSSVEMRELLSQPSCDPEKDCIVAVSEDIPVGFAIVARELRIGRTVANGGVLEDRRREGIGRSLLTRVMAYVSSLGAKVLHIEAPDGSDGARHLLESSGFRPVRRYCKMRWEGESAPAVVVPEGFALCAFRYGTDEQALTDLQNATFNGSWGFCPNTVEEISVRARSSRCHPDGIIILTTGEGRLAGYNWTTRTGSEDGAVGWIEMTGVHPDFRSRGLGRAVVVAGMAHLKENGVNSIELEVDSQNAPATTLYRRLGFRSVGQGIWYEKRLKTAS